MQLRLFCFLAAALFATPVLAQSQAAFVAAFSGKWQSYDARLATGTAPCSFELGATPGVDGLPAVPSDCRPPLAVAKTWSIEGSQLALYDAAGRAVARLGGNQKRMTGDTPDGDMVVLERPGGDGTAAGLIGAYNASGCYYVGYSQTCAKPAEIARPDPGPDGKIRIYTYADLNLREQPRSDASVIGELKQSACVAATACIVASDGPWCAVSAATATGWVRKLSLRQKRWPVVGFANTCP